MRQKQKTRKSIIKRFKVTGTGKIVFYPAKRRHLLTGKPSKKMLRLRRSEVANSVETKRIRALIPT